MDINFSPGQIILLSYDGFLRGQARLSSQVEKCGLIGRITLVKSPASYHFEGLKILQNPNGKERRIEPGNFSQAELYHEDHRDGGQRYILEIDACQIICNVETYENMMINSARNHSRKYAQQLAETITKLKKKR